MAKWAAFPLVRPVLSFMLGILTYTWIDKSSSLWFAAFVVLVAFYAAAVWLMHRIKKPFFTTLTGILSLCCFFMAGAGITHIHTETNYANHLQNLQEPVLYYQAQVSEAVLEKPKSYQTTVTVTQVKTNEQWKPARGKVKLTIQKKDALQLPAFGDVVLIKGSPQPVPAPANPHAFNYKKFLSRKQVYHQQFVQPQQLLIIGAGAGNPVEKLSLLVRNNLEGVFSTLLGNSFEKGIASALVLGIRDDLDNNIRDAYAATGTMHVLAVSGLHVGLLFAILAAVFGLMKRLPGHRMFSSLFILIFIWAYAFITGLSPSVLRAVMMFTLVVLAQLLGRRPRIYNSLAIAAGGLLVYSPFWLFEVGFQLSFLAVLGIVYLQPRLSSLLQFDNRFLKGVWALFTVALAAQLATFPLGLYYFHQFPTYFWIANIVVVPMATVTLWLGLAVLLLSWIPLLNQFLALILESWISGMNWFILHLQELPYSTLNGFTLSTTQVWLMYAFLLLLILFLVLRRLYFFSLATLSMAVLSLTEVLEDKRQQKQVQWAVYQVPGQEVQSFIRGKQTAIKANLGNIIQTPAFKFAAMPNLLQRGTLKSIKDTINSNILPASAVLPDGNELLVWQGLRILILKNKLKLQPRQPFQLDYVLLQQNAPFDVQELTRNFRFKQLILDGSNRRWYQQKVAEELKQAQVPVHNVATEGAFVLEVR